MKLWKSLKSLLATKCHVLCFSLSREGRPRLAGNATLASRRNRHATRRSASASHRNVFEPLGDASGLCLFGRIATRFASERKAF